MSNPIDKWKWHTMGGTAIPGGGGMILYKTKGGELSSNPMGASHWMELPPDPKPALPKPMEIGDGRHRAEFATNGTVRVGCTLVPFEKLREIFETADNVRKENA
jgi:hypothetical protein